LCFSRRKALECVMRSMSRWKQVRMAQGSSSRSRPRLQTASVPEFYTIGDCASARKMGDAIREGYYTAVNL